MNDETDVIFEPAVFDMTNEMYDCNGYAPTVEVYFPDGSAGLITSPERFATEALALRRAAEIAAQQRERVTALYREGVV